MRTLALLFILLFNFAADAQSLKSIQQNTCFKSEFVDKEAKEKFMIYVFFGEGKTTYVLKSKENLSTSKIKKIQENYNQLNSKGVYILYPENKIVVRTNNSEQSKSHKVQAHYANLKGNINSNGDLVCSYSDDEISTENLTFELLK